MMARLRRLPRKAEEVKVWDLSLLSPADQDRASELLKLIGDTKDISVADLDIVFVEFGNLVRDLPLLGRDDAEQGPLIEAPGTLVDYWQRQRPLSSWRSLDFSKLSKVQTLRFVELCEQYGFEMGTSVPIKAQMVPLAVWEAANRTELQDMLNMAARKPPGDSYG